MCNIILDPCSTVGLIYRPSVSNVNLTIKEKRESLAALDLSAFVINVFIMNTLKGFLHWIICFT